MSNDTESNIQYIKDCVKRIIDNESSITQYHPIWQSCVNVLSYMLDLSPKSLRNVRLHTEIFSGEFFNFTLFNAANQHPGNYAEGLGYTFATENLEKKYWISEPPIDGWTAHNNEFGCKYEGYIINPEIARYQLYIENFVDTNMIDNIINSPQKSVVMEIGAGYGAIGHNLLKMAKHKVCYIVLDLPLMLLYTGCYLATHNPDAKIFIYDPNNDAHKNIDDAIINYDVVLIPSHRLSVLEKLSRVDYAINTISMAEMHANQVQEYVDFIKPRLTQYFYFQNYAWIDTKPLHHFVGEHFNATPKLDFYENYIKTTHTTISGNYLRTFYFTTSNKPHEDLKNCTIKLFMPNSKHGRISLDKESIEIRHSPNKYAPLSIIASNIKRVIPINKNLLKKIRHRIKAILLA